MNADFVHPVNRIRVYVAIISNMKGHVGSYYRLERYLVTRNGNAANRTKKSATARHGMAWLIGWKGRRKSACGCKGVHERRTRSARIVNESQKERNEAMIARIQFQGPDGELEVAASVQKDSKRLQGGYNSHTGPMKGRREATRHRHNSGWNLTRDYWRTGRRYEPDHQQFPWW